MLLSKRIARSCIHLGVVQLIFGCAGVACGAVARSKLTGKVGATIGLWAAYVSRKCIDTDTIIYDISLRVCDHTFPYHKNSQMILNNCCQMEMSCISLVAPRKALF